MRLISLLHLFAFLIAIPGLSHASESPSSPVITNDGVSVAQTVNQVRCNIADAIDLANRNSYGLSIDSVKLTLSVRRSSENEDEFSIEVPVFEDQIKMPPIGAVNVGDISRESYHEVIVGFTPETSSEQQSPLSCFGHLGFVETLQQLASAMVEPAHPAILKMEVKFDADFILKKRRDRDHGWVIYGTEATTTNTGIQNIKIDATLTTTLRAPPAAGSSPSPQWPPVPYHLAPGSGFIRPM